MAEQETSSDTARLEDPTEKAQRFADALVGTISSQQARIERAEATVSLLRTNGARLQKSRSAMLEALQLLQGFDFRLDDSPHGVEIKRRALAAIEGAAE